MDNHHDVVFRLLLQATRSNKCGMRLLRVGPKATVPHMPVDLDPNALNLQGRAVDVLVGCSILARIYRRLSAGWRDHVDIGVVADVGIDSRPDLEYNGFLGGPVRKTMAVWVTGSEACRIACAKPLL